MTRPHTTNCAIYPLFRLESILNVWKLNYCESNYSRCARFQLSCDARPVPATLLPNGKHLAQPEPLAAAAGKK